MKNRRVTRERKTVEAMIIIYCRGMHQTGKGLCKDCRTLLEYANRRLNKCPFQGGKTTCANCRIHCYKPDMRNRIRNVMKYSGPRMTYRHPALALFHFIDGFRRKPVTRTGKK